MSNVTQLHNNTRCDDEAGKWIAKIDRGLNKSEKVELGAWISADHKNYLAFVDMAELWDEMDAMVVLAEICPKPISRKPVWTRMPLQFAAATLLAIAGALWFSNARLPSPADLPAVVDRYESSETYSTAIGEQETFELTDGSTVLLNTNSMVIVKYSAMNRILVLERGEIHVVVAHDPDNRPLSVLVADRVVQAVGTEFNIEITSDRGIELVVTEGLVVIGVLDLPPDELPVNEPVRLEQESKLIAGGQEAIIQHLDETLLQIEARSIETEDIAVKLSWRNGNLVFRGETLEEAMEEVGRYTAVEFVFLDEESKKEQVAGLFKAGDVDGLLAVLRKNFNITYEWISDDKVVLGSQ